MATYDTQADDDPDLPSPFVRKVTRVPEARLRPSGSAGGSNLLARAAHNYAAVRSAAAAAAAASEAKTDAAAAPAQSTLSRMWNSPIGVKTVHFWFVLPLSI